MHTTAARAPMTKRAWTSADAPVVVVEAPRGLARDAAALVRALPAASERLRAHGLLWRVPLHVVVHDDVAGFVRATGQTTASLRAWTTWDTVHLLPRDTWSRDDDDAVVARLAHELCHAALAQRRADVDDARAHRAPRFVTEGACSVVAQQAVERMPLADVRVRVDDGERVDFDDDPVFAYALAHHVFASFVACRGDSALLDVVDRAAGGERVEALLGDDPTAWLDGCVANAGEPQPAGFPRR